MRRHAGHGVSRDQLPLRLRRCEATGGAPRRPARIAYELRARQQRAVVQHASSSLSAKTRVGTPGERRQDREGREGTRTRRERARSAQGSDERREPGLKRRVRREVARRPDATPRGACAQRQRRRAPPRRRRHHWRARIVVASRRRRAPPRRRSTRTPAPTGACAASSPVRLAASPSPPRSRSRVGRRAPGAARSAGERPSLARRTVGVGVGFRVVSSLSPGRSSWRPRGSRARGRSR